MTSVEIKLGLAKPYVEVDGNDISDAVNDIQIFWRHLSVPQVALVLSSESVSVIGDAEVELQTNASLADLLDGIDTKELEARALGREGWGGSVTDNIIAILKERANGGH